MKVVNAIWEWRNLGRKALEVTLEPSDSVDSLRNLRANDPQAYIVARIPSTFAAALWQLPDIGFIFVESMFHCHYAGADFELNTVQQRILNTARVKILKSNEVQLVLDEVRQGIFSTDRIALDPRFGVRISNERYCNWIKDECDKGGTLSIVEVNSQPIGFYAVKNLPDGSAHLFLSGLFHRYHKTGLGFCTHVLGIQEGLRQGANKVRLAFSSNNIGAAGLHFQKGHRLDAVYHVFVSTDWPASP